MKVEILSAKRAAPDTLGADYKVVVISLIEILGRLQ